MPLPPCPRDDPAPDFTFVWLALCGAALAYACVLAAAAPLPSGQAKRWGVFAATWLLAPAAGFGFAGLGRALRRRRWPGHPGFDPLLLTACHAACAMALLLPPWPNDPAWPAHTVALALGLCALALAALALAPQALAQGARALRAAALASGALAALALWATFGGPAALAAPKAAIILAPGALLAWRLCRPGAAGRTPWAAADWLLLALLLWWLLPWRPQPEPFHEGYYLGPANDLLHGRSLLVDSSCQYGVGVVYGVAGAFALLRLPLSVDGLYCLDALLFLAVYLAAYVVLRRLLGSRALAALAVAVAVGVERFDPFLWQDNARFPSVGPLRFGPPLLLLLAAWRRRRRGSSRLAEGLLLGLAGLWSLESLAYALAGYGAFRAGEAWLDHRSPRAALGAWGRSLAFAALCLGLAHAAFALAIRACAGAWPDWGLYWDYLSLYAGGLMAMDFPLRYPWPLAQGICLASAVACLALLARRSDRSDGLLLVFGLTLASVAEFSYFVSRSHPANLDHLALPPALLAAYWLDRLARSRALPRAAALALCFAGGAVAAALLLNAAPAGLAARSAVLACARPGGPWRSLAELAGRLEHPVAVEPLAAEAAGLARRDLPGRARVVMLLPDQVCVEAQLLAGTCDLAPVADPNEDGQILARLGDPHLDDALRAGDLILAGPFTPSLEIPGSFPSRMQEQRLRRLSRRFRFQPVDQGPLGVRVLRLVAPSPAAPGPSSGRRSPPGSVRWPAGWPRAAPNAATLRR